MNYMIRRAVYITAMIATMIGVPPAHASKQSNRARIHQLEARNTKVMKAIDHLMDIINAQGEEIRKLKNVDAGIKNTLMCLHGVAITPLTMLIQSPAETFQVQPTFGLNADWVVTVDYYCLQPHGVPDARIKPRLQVPVEPPTFFPESY